MTGWAEVSTFWEYAPKQALNFAKIRQRQYRKKRKKSAYDELRATESLAVVACMIRLGFCLDLTEPENVEYVGKVFDSYKEAKEIANAPLPTNRHHYRKLDREIFNFAYKVIEDSEPNLKVDTARGIYVPTDGSQESLGRQLDIAGIPTFRLCVRNPASILGTWLHYPTGLEVNDVCQALQVGPAILKPDDPEGEGIAEDRCRSPRRST